MSLEKVVYYFFDGSSSATNYLPSFVSIFLLLTYHIISAVMFSWRKLWRPSRSHGIDIPGCRDIHTWPHYFSSRCKKGFWRHGSLQFRRQQHLWRNNRVKLSPSTCLPKIKCKDFSSKRRLLYILRSLYWCFVVFFVVVFFPVGYLFHGSSMPLSLGLFKSTRVAWHVPSWFSSVGLLSPFTAFFILLHLFMSFHAFCHMTSPESLIFVLVLPWQSCWFLWSWRSHSLSGS